ncbi:MAG: diaminopimelate epimerase [Thermodesulfobacteriota bacterium]
MKSPQFIKMSGAGNDFIIIDNRDLAFAKEKMPELARKWCARKLSVGADGLIFLENSEKADFRWQFFNSDGSEAEMCGNASRCVARLAFEMGMAPKSMRFETIAGIIEAEILEDGVKAKLTDPRDQRFFFPLDVAGAKFNVSFVNTGVPHVVLLVDDVETSPVVEHGRLIRNHPAFAPAGTNVNFAQFLRGGEIKLRTYERGVEDETLACGTGAVAAAIVRSAADASFSPISVHTRGGMTLAVHFTKKGLTWKDIYLEGEARIIYRAEMGPDA